MTPASRGTFVCLAGGVTQVSTLRAGRGQRLTSAIDPTVGGLLTEITKPRVKGLDHVDLRSEHEYLHV
jgi:hypothetical protein